MPDCLACFVNLDYFYRRYVKEYWRPITEALRKCSKRRCKWWCACCNRWLCWLAIVVILVLEVIAFSVLELLVTIVCAVATLACLMCIVVCALGSLGKKSIFEQCLEDYCKDLESMVKYDSGDGLTIETGGGTTTEETGGGKVPTLPLELSVTRLEDLRQLIGWRHQLLGVPRVRIAIEHMRSSDLKVVQAAVDRYARGCGCREGQIGVGIAMAALLLFRHELFDMASWGRVGTMTLGFLAVGAIGGKILGLARERLLLYRSLRGVVLNRKAC